MKQTYYAKDILKLDGANASLIAKRVGRSPRTIQEWMRRGIPKSARDDCIAALERHQRAIGKKRTSTSDLRPPTKKRATSNRQSAVSKKRAPTPDLRPPKKKAISNQQSAVGKKKEIGSRQSAVGKKLSSGRKPIAESRESKKAARIAPKPSGGKPQKAVSSRQSALSKKALRRPQTRRRPPTSDLRKTTRKSEVGGRKSLPVGVRPSAVGGRTPSGVPQRPRSVLRPKPLSGRKPVSGRLPIAEGRKPVWKAGTFVPLTKKEKSEQEQQLRLAVREQKRIHDIKEHNKAVRLVHQIRKSGVNGMRRVYRLHGKNPKQRLLLSWMIDNDDEAWTKFVDMCEELGLSNVEIRNAWFSPK